MTDSAVCSKCATIKKSGKLSCCANGGAWFKNCGDPGHPDFDHTWFEGIQVCKDSNSKAQSQVMSGHEQENAVRKSNDPQQKNKGSVSADPAVTDGQGCNELAKITVFMSLLFAILHLRI